MGAFINDNCLLELERRHILQSVRGFVETLLYFSVTHRCRHFAGYLSRGDRAGKSPRGGGTGLCFTADYAGEMLEISLPVEPAILGEDYAFDEG